MSIYATVSEAADILNVSSDTIRRWAKKGLIKDIRNESNYRIFSIQELERVKNKIVGSDLINNYQILKNDKTTIYTSIDLFAGAGGTALGLENAGFKHLLLNELNKNAVSTLRKNRPHWNVVLGDIATIDFTQWNGKVDLIEGGFPCQSFSYAGKRRGFEDTRGTLFYEFARAVKEARPKIAMGENVKGLLRHDSGRTLETMISILEKLDYKVAYKVLRSQYLDVPQKRERLIIIAVRNDLNLSIFFPKEKNYIISLKEALKNCPISDGITYSLYKKQIKALTIGEETKVMNLNYYKNFENLKKEFKKLTHQKCVILIKGSRSIGLDKLISQTHF